MLQVDHGVKLGFNWTFDAWEIRGAEGHSSRDLRVVCITTLPRADRRCLLRKASHVLHYRHHICHSPVVVVPCPLCKTCVRPQ